MNNQLEVIVKESGLEVIDGQTIIEKFGNYEQVSKEWEAKAKMIVVTSSNQVAEMEMARAARKKFSDMRIEVEKTRKAMKEQSLRKGQAIDAIARYITSLIAPIEDYLRLQEDFKKIEEAKKAEQLRLAEEARIEAERVAKEKAEAEEKERIRLENEKLRKELEAKEVEAQKERAKAQAVLDAQIKKANEERAEAERAKREQEAILNFQRAEAERKQKELEAKLANTVECPKCKFIFSLNHK